MCGKIESQIVDLDVRRVMFLMILTHPFSTATEVRTWM